MQFITNEKEILAQLQILLKEAVTPLQKFAHRAITFSGGLDSSIIAHLLPNTLLVAVGMQGCKDFDHALSAAIAQRWQLKMKVLTAAEIETWFETIIPLLHTNHIECNSPNVCLATLLAAALREMAKIGTKHVITGYGADALFAGFDWHSANATYPQEIHENLLMSLQHAKEEIRRDALIAQQRNMTLHHPFLYQPLVDYAMRISPLLKVHNNIKKAILRDTATRLGLPTMIVMRPKAAAQYSSKIDHALLQCAKRIGSKKRKGYIASILGRDHDTTLSMEESTSI